jgi:transposase
MTMTAASLNGRAHTGGVNKDDIDLAASPRRRSFTADYKAEIFVEYDAHRKGSEARGSILRREGLYSSHISEWRKRAKVGAWEGLARESKKRCSVEEIELEKLRRQNELLSSELVKTQTTLEITGKVHALLEQLSESADTEARLKP